MANRRVMSRINRAGLCGWSESFKLPLDDWTPQSAPWEGYRGFGRYNMDLSAVARGRAPLLAAAIAGGILLGFTLAFRLDEEARRRIQKTLYELRELPFRVLI